jgi:hypothetical protein
LSEVERSLFERAPEKARDLIANIPRLEKVAEIVYLQDRGFDGTGFPQDGPSGNDIPVDARLLKILKDLVEATDGGPPTKAAFLQLDARESQYDPKLLSGVRACLGPLAAAGPETVMELPVASLEVGMQIFCDIRLSNGHLIIANGTHLSQPQVDRLRNLGKIFTFVEPIKIKR